MFKSPNTIIEFDEITKKGKGGFDCSRHTKELLFSFTVH